jgi:carbon monoxide dehydrogenase subunit G
MLRLEFQVAKPPQHVFAVLSDMQKFVAIHPVISEAQALGQDRYKLKETLRFVGIPLRFRYEVHVYANHKQLQVLMTAKVMLLVGIQIQFDVSGNDKESLVKEQISFKTVLPVHFILRSIFRKQHSKLFAAMK